MSNPSDSFVLVGVVVKPHGIKGELSVVPQCDSPKVFQAGERLFVEKGDDWVEQQIVACRSHQGNLILSLAGTRDRTEAEALRQCRLFFEKGKLGEPGEQEFYHYELMDARVVDVGGNPVGQVSAVFDQGAMNHLEIETPHGRFLLPFVDKYVVSISRESEIVLVIDHFEELLTLNS